MRQVSKESHLQSEKGPWLGIVSLYMYKTFLCVKSFSFKWTSIFSKPIKDLKIKDSGNLAEYTQDLRDCST